uniref:HTH La-type RNA-binding domain-containing protein n=1 Tax=Gopherus agassizii TaxID=38772 RepID=A0A452HH37_9SAUR
MYALLSAWLRYLLCLLLPVGAAEGESWPSPPAPREGRRGPAAQEQEGSGAGGAAAALTGSEARRQRQDETAAAGTPGASLLARLRRLWRALPWHRLPTPPSHQSPMAELPPGCPQGSDPEQPGVAKRSPEPLEDGPGGAPSPVGVGEAGAGKPGSGPVRIRVAIPEEEEEDEEDGRAPGLTLLGGGSCSEDDSGRYGKSSSGENDGDDFDQDWKPPDNELIQKLVTQVEYYFSDENLEKDAFLLKHVRRNKMGYVSVKLLTSFKKVKHLTRDWRITAYALKYSDILELNEDSRKVRRNTPVPVFASETLPSKMLLVYDIHLISELQVLSQDQENGCMQEKMMEHLLKTFVTFGVISSVRILKPGKDLPTDVKRFSNRYNQVGTKECAIVEFEEVDAAIKAHEIMCIEKSNENGMKVILIGMKPPKKKVVKDKNHDEDPSKSLNKNRSLNKRVEELQYVGYESSANSSSDPESNPTSPLSGRKTNTSNKLSPTTYQNNHLSPNVSPRSSPWNSPSSLRKVSRKSPLAEDGKLNPSISPEISWKCADYSSDSSITPSSSPWVQRRRQAQTVTQEKSPRLSLISIPTAFSDHKMDNKLNMYLTDLGRRNFLMNQNGTNTKNIQAQVMQSNLVSTSGCGPVMDRKQLSYIKVIDSIKPWRTAGKPFVCDRFSLWAS